MSTMDKINELISRKKNIENSENPSGVNKSRERINFLLDPDSFVEVGAFVKHRSTDFNMEEKSAPADGVVTGYGTINGRLVYVYSQDASVMGGSLGEMHAKKIANVYEMAMRMGAPVVGILDSAGIRLQESTDGLNGYGEVFLQKSMASGVIPQVSVIMGTCAGGATVLPGLSDFTFMAKDNGKLFVNSPNTMEKNTEIESIGSAEVHSKETGLVDFICETEGDCFAQVRQLLDLLPSNNMDEAPLYEVQDDLNRVSEVLDEGLVDSMTLIGELADQQLFIEVKQGYGTSLVVGFIQMAGTTVGVLSNQESVMDIASLEKAASFVQFCDAYNIPLLTLTSATGFLASQTQEKAGLAKSIAKLTHAFAHATCPKVNVIVGETTGSAYVSFNSKHIGADIVFAWPQASISVMDADSAVRIIYGDEINASDRGSALVAEKVEEYKSMQASPYAAASRGYIDDIIEPASTRKRVIAAFEMLASKREKRPSKKHSTML